MIHYRGLSFVPQNENKTKKTFEVSIDCYKVFTVNLSSVRLYGKMTEGQQGPALRVHFGEVLILQSS